MTHTKLEKLDRIDTQQNAINTLDIYQKVYIYDFDVNDEKFVIKNTICLLRIKECSNCDGGI